MTRKRTIVLAAGAAAALAVAGGGAALAASGALSPQERSKAIIDDAAEQLGVEPDELSAALEQALKNRIDEAVEDGRLTEEQGRAAKERIDSADVPLVFGPIGHPRFGGPGVHIRLGTGIEALTDYLDLTHGELGAALRDGKSLADIAKDQGKSVEGLVDALTKAAEERIDRAVERGRLSAERAAELKASLEERITKLVEREPGDRPFRFGPRFRHGGSFGGFHGGIPAPTGPRG